MEKIIDIQKNYINRLFDKIAFRYDLLNHIMSFGIDKIWRRRAIKCVSAVGKKLNILDVATGTADLAIVAMRCDPQHIVGIDISTKMLEIGRRKVREKGFSDKIELKEASSENIPFDDNYFDVAMVAFGVRNFSNLRKGLSEMRRVTKEGGAVVILEFSKPRSFPFKQLYNFYLFKVIPCIGRIISKEKEAYSYLPESIKKFPDNDDFLNIMSETGLKNVRQEKLTFGVASIYVGNV